MSGKTGIFASVAKVGGVLGKGLIAGFAGTIAITISQMIEMQIENKGMTTLPATVGGKALGVEPRGEAQQEKEKAQSNEREASEEVQHKVEKNEQKFAQLMHFSYGTCWGFAREAMDLAGIRGPLADLLLFGSSLGTAFVMLPSATKLEPVTNWTPKQITVEALHHVVYACGTGLTYDAMRNAEIKKRRKIKIW